MRCVDATNSKRAETMRELCPLLIFQLNGQRYALPLAVVERVVSAVEVTPLPGAPTLVLGAINLEGCVIPVLDMRQRFGLPRREIYPEDQFLIAHTVHKVVALVIDEALDVIEKAPSAVCSSASITSGLDQFKGMIQLDDGLVLIQDLEKFLSLDEARALDAVMEPAE